MTKWSAGVVVLIASCAGRQGETSSGISTCELEDEAAACAAPSQSVTPTAAEADAPYVVTGVAYEVAAGPGGWLAFDAPSTGSYTLYMRTSKPTHVCDVDILQPGCESPVSCAAFDEAREYAMIAGHRYELGIPASTEASHVELVAPTGNGVGPDIEITQAPAEGATIGPFVQLAFVIGDFSGDISCRLDNVPGACRPDDTAPPYRHWSFWNNLPPGDHRWEISAADAQGNVTVVTRHWTTACAPPSTTDAVGLLHLDGTTDNATGGAPLVLGDPAPTFTTDGRFGGALAFVSGQQASWQVSAGTLSQFSIELEARPDSSTTTPQDLVTTADGRFRIRTVVDGGHQFAFVAVQDDGSTVELREAAATPGVWHHLLVSYDGATLHAWQDNAEYDRPVQMSGIDLGRLQLGGAYGGSLDEVWVSTTAITDLFAGWAGYCPLHYPNP